MAKKKGLTLKESVANWLSGKSKINKNGPYVGRNDRTRIRRQKWEPKISMEGRQVLPSGAIVNRYLQVTQKTSTRR